MIEGRDPERQDRKTSISQHNMTITLPDGTTVATEFSVSELTTVFFRQGDAVGQMLAMASLLPFVVLLVLGSGLLFRRDVIFGTFLAFLVSNEALNQVLKRVIREPRPSGLQSRKEEKKNDLTTTI